jgi:hypothetical protein
MLARITTLQLRAFSAVYLSAVYAFGIFSKTAWSDDYPALVDPSDVALHAIRDSRLVYGGLIDLLFHQFDSIALLSFVRLFGFLGLLLLADLILVRFLKIQNSISIVFATVIAFTLPSFQFSAHWAITFMMCWAAYLATLGFVLQESERLVMRLMGFLSFICSLLLYPLMSFFVVAYLYTTWFLRQDSIKALIMGLKRLFLLMVASATTSYIIAYSYLHLHGLTFMPRVSVVNIDSLPEKLVYFFSRPFALTYRPYLLDSPSLAGYLATVGIFAFLLLLLLINRYKTFAIAFQHFLVFNFFIVLTILPLLVVGDNQIDLRFVASNTWLYMFMFIFLFMHLGHDRELGIRKIIATFVYPVVGLLLVIGFATVNLNFLNYYQNPFEQKQGFFSQQISSCNKELLAKNIIILPRTTPWENKSLIGIYSQQTDLQSDWVPVGALALYLRDAGFKLNSLPTMKQEEITGSNCYVNLDDYPNP